MYGKPTLPNRRPRRCQRGTRTGLESYCRTRISSRQSHICPLTQANYPVRHFHRQRIQRAQQPLRIQESNKFNINRSRSLPRIAH
ncbi:hypothetical protein BDV39DRAFT_187221 [Aspergillus sergii]|uniref:Uncharacterized protein n=1 Tax=Aspergillus sergii TaxID=1034303 RepID=A0A5N6WIT8_9EURO|nr:hypothetical protein BDV39DRAFT_187221 [Aspergillus sergii]